MVCSHPVQQLGLVEDVQPHPGMLGRVPSHRLVRRHPEQTESEHERRGQSLAAWQPEQQKRREGAGQRDRRTERRPRHQHSGVAARRRVAQEQGQVLGRIGRDKPEEGPPVRAGPARAAGGAAGTEAPPARRSRPCAPPATAYSAGSSRRARPPHRRRGRRARARAGRARGSCGCHRSQCTHMRSRAGATVRSAMSRTPCPHHLRNYRPPRPPVCRRRRAAASSAHSCQTEPAGPSRTRCKHLHARPPATPTAAPQAAHAAGGLAATSQLGSSREWTCGAVCTCKMGAGSCRVSQSVSRRII
eukprot:scaffold5292_cov113-Isochrysis_galbana.AAC.9